MTKLGYYLERNRGRLNGFFLYLVLIPFLRPRGFDESWLWHKTFFTLWLYGAIALIALYFLLDIWRNGLGWKGYMWGVAAYYVLFALETFVQQKGFHEGYQKMFAAPALYVFCYLALKDDPKRFLLAMANILTVEFILGVTVFCPPIIGRLIGVYHVNFLGHVHVAAQYGLVGALTAYLLYRLDGRLRVRCLVLAGLSLVQTLWSGTAAGKLALLVVIAGAAAWYLPKLRLAVLLHPQVYYIGYVILNVLMLLFSFTGLDRALGINITFSGRTTVWREAFKLILEHPFLGYGAYGAQIVVPWSHGMNYAHNEFVQRLLDGGIVLCAAYILMLFFMVRAAGGVRGQKNRAVVNTLMMSMLLVMLFESVTDYYYCAFFFMLLAGSPEILDRKKRKWSGNSR